MTRKIMLLAERFAHTRRWAYAETGWSRIASLAPVVLQCAEDGDSTAFKIVTSAAHEALEALVAVATKMRLKGQRFRLVLSGILSISDSDNCQPRCSRRALTGAQGWEMSSFSVLCIPWLKRYPGGQYDNFLLNA